MTTTITIEAHCDPETEEVVVRQAGQPYQVLQDGDTHTTYCWDGVGV